MNDENDGIETEENAETESLFKRVQNQLTEMTENAFDSVPMRIALSSIGEDGWLKNFYINPLEPSRLQAMADAGLFLKDARELADMSITDLATAIGLKDKDLLYEVERGETTLSFDLIFRLASLLARHDPIPFIIKFLRTYSPAVDSAMEKLGVGVIPRHIERARRFSNIYRSHDKLRQFSDQEFDRFCSYMASSTDFIMEVMETEKGIAKRIEIEESNEGNSSAE